MNASSPRYIVLVNDNEVEALCNKEIRIKNQITARLVYKRGPRLSLPSDKISIYLNLIV